MKGFSKKTPKKRKEWDREELGAALEVDSPEKSTIQAVSKSLPVRVPDSKAVVLDTTRSGEQRLTNRITFKSRALPTNKTWCLFFDEDDGSGVLSGLKMGSPDEDENEDEDNHMEEAPVLMEDDEEFSFSDGQELRKEEAERPG